MSPLQAIQLMGVTAIGVLTGLACLNNLTDYNTNFALVQHVLSMDTTFPESTLRWRAITSSTVHHAAYWLIIATEGVGGSTLSDWGLQNALGAKGGHCNFQPKQERCTMGVRHRVDPVPCRIHGHRCGVVRHVAVAEVGWAATRIFESSCA